MAEGKGHWQNVQQGQQQLPAPPLPAPPFPGPPPARPYSEGAKAWGIVGVVTGIVGWLLLPILFGPIALISGIVALSLHYQGGWWGIFLGGGQLLYVGYHLARFSDALNRLG